MRTLRIAWAMLVIAGFVAVLRYPRFLGVFLAATALGSAGFMIADRRKTPT